MSALVLFGASDPDQILDKSPLGLSHPDNHAIITERKQVERQLNEQLYELRH